MLVIDIGLIKMSDFMNHKRPRMTTWGYSDERNGFYLQALEDIPKGCQVHLQNKKSRIFLPFRFLIALVKNAIPGFC